MIDRKKQDLLGRIFLTFFSILVIAYGILSFLKGELNYSNYWGGVVFAPVTILFGVFILYIILFKWKILAKNKEALKNKRKSDDFIKW